MWGGLIGRPFKPRRKRSPYTVADKDGNCLGCGLNDRQKDGRCKPCHNKRRAEKYRENHDHIREYKRRYRRAHPDMDYFIYMRQRYGIGQVEYELLFDQQDGRCDICGRHVTEIRHKTNRNNLHVDHNHETGQVRGLLCFNCNTGLGNFHDSIKNLKQAINYLKRHNRGPSQ